MNLKSQISSPASIFIFALLVSCSSTGPNPLEDYEEVVPATVIGHPEASPDGDYSPELVARGSYMVKLLRCGACHTDGALVGRPDRDRLLAGSSVGIAYTNPLEDRYPGVVFPSNLTPDHRTGLGAWTQQEIVEIIRDGTDNHGSRKMSVMPYQAYSSINDEDAAAIAAYLGSLKPVRHQVPRNVGPGMKTPAQFVHFGVYRSKK